MKKYDKPECMLKIISGRVDILTASDFDNDGKDIDYGTSISILHN